MWTCESISPGQAVVLLASTTTSQDFSSPARTVPTFLILPPDIRMESPLAKGRFQSPVTMVPILMIAVFMVPPP